MALATTPPLRDHTSGPALSAVPPAASPAVPTTAAAGLRPPITAIRWGTVAVGLVLASPAISDGEVRSVVAGLALVTFAGWRTWRPPPTASGEDLRVLLGVLAEVGFHVLAVLATGSWDSPFVFSLITAVLAAGFARGLAFAIRVALASALAVGAGALVSPVDELEADLRLTAQWACELVLIAAAAGYARRLSGEAEARHTVALDRLGRLSEANSLLYSLHRVAQSLPASLDLDEVLDSTVSRLRELIDVGFLVVLVPDDTSSSWLVSRSDGVRLPKVVDLDDLPPALRSAVGHGRARRHDLLTGGVSPRARSGLYAQLRARDQLVGLVALEHEDPDHFTGRDVDLLDGFTEAAALAVDNARWFARLRTVGADEERTRIARELHDRVGQSLAYLAFEMDRLIASTPDDALRHGIEGLRTDVRTVLGEVRDTLYDLRTDVSESSDIATTLEQYLQRIAARSTVAVAFRSRATARLPLRQEREVWRIAQEAIANAERHGRPTTIAVDWSCDGTAATLEVIDDGAGFEAGRAGRLDSYGLLGMRERAAGIGAALDLDSTPGGGTVVRCSLP